METVRTWLCIDGITRFVPEGLENREQFEGGCSDRTNEFSCVDDNILCAECLCDRRNPNRDEDVKRCIAHLKELSDESHS